MTSFQGLCPQCGSEIPNERLITGSAICQCGWHDMSANAKATRRNENKTITFLVAVTIGLSLGYWHLLNWGSYAVSIPFVKLQQITGTLSKQGLEDLAQACIKLNKWSCAQDAYLAIYRNHRDVEGLAKLAHFQVRIEAKESAMSTYASYFQTGGKNGEAALEYAELLEKSGRDETALTYYEKSIELRSETLPVQATAGIVRILVKQGHPLDAHERLVAFHESAGNAKGYLNTELEQVESALAQQGVRPSQRKNASRRTAQRESSPTRVKLAF